MWCWGATVGTKSTALHLPAHDLSSTAAFVLQPLTDEQAAGNLYRLHGYATHVSVRVTAEQASRIHQHLPEAPHAAKQQGWCASPYALPEPRRVRYAGSPRAPCGCGEGCQRCGLGAGVIQRIVKVDGRHGCGGVVAAEHAVGCKHPQARVRANMHAMSVPWMREHRKPALHRRCSSHASSIHGPQRG